ncbi:MAG: RNA polymerase sigma-70 factor [Bacteroidota bacterium]
MFLSKRKRKQLDIRTEDGFTDLYKNHVDFVFLLCYRYLRDKSLSEDITSKIFASLWERRNELYEDSWQADSWKRYLTKAVKHKLYDHVRSQERVKNFESEAARTFQTSDNTTEKELFFGELAGQVNDIVTQLPPKCRQVFLLSRKQGLTNKEIAKNLAISDHAVKKHIAKALNYLRDNLSGYSVPKRATGS